jgi:hypothetical protein
MRICNDKFSVYVCLKCKTVYIVPKIDNDIDYIPCICGDQDCLLHNSFDLRRYYTDIDNNIIYYNLKKTFKDFTFLRRLSLYNIGMFEKFQYFLYKSKKLATKLVGKLIK